MGKLISKNEYVTQINEIIKIFREVDIPRYDELCQKELNYVVEDIEAIKKFVKEDSKFISDK